ncbi:acyl carrier protein [Nonomuraea sp. PA05]|uniref:acyl carrier protein n=1 Tax=Nonomuraea sp. PA05 TaxID=2604466 RepID=UPI001CA30C82|nr:acyl carrier protein [Nonomuraea sp. PA05]
MSTSSEVIDAELAARGTGDITTHQALRAWDSAVQAAAPHLAVFRLKAGADDASRPPLLRGLMAPARPGGIAGAASARFLALNGDQLRAAVYDEVRAAVAEVLGTQADAIDGERALPDLGIDSLLAVRLRVALEARTDVALPANVLWNRPTSAQIAAHLADLLSGRRSEEATTTGATA